MGSIGEFLDRFNPFKQPDSKNIKNSIPGIPEQTRKVEYIETEFDKALEFQEDDRERNSEAWRLYGGLDNQQWPEEIKAKMAKEGRNPFQANFIRSKVDGLAGAIIKNFFDINYEPVEGQYSDLTRLAEALLLSDKELLDWNAAYKEAIIGGLVQESVEEMFVSDRYNPLGNIGFRYLLPQHYVLDPNWLTNNAWDLKKLWKVAYMTPEEIKSAFSTKSDEIDTLISMRDASGDDGEYNQGDKTKGYPRFNLDERYGRLYRVIEFHHIEVEKHKVEVTIDKGLVVPEGSDEEKSQWAIYNQIDLTQGVIEREVGLNVYYVTTICPELSESMLLEDRQGFFQVGRLPFFVWSAARINGKNSGIPELLKSIQQTYNKRESMLDHMISTSANGAKLGDPDLFDGNQAKMDSMVENVNNSAYFDWTAPGALASGREFIKELPRTQMDYGVVNEINRMLDMADRVSKQPASSDGRSEGSEESGILFARKQLQAEITQTVLMESLKNYWNEKGEAYLLGAKQLYSGVYREFMLPGEDRVVEVNKPVLTSRGEVVTNDLSQLPRMMVIVGESPLGTTQRAVDRANNIELLRVLGEQNPISRADATKNVMKSLDNSNAERATLVKDAELEKELARMSVLVKTKQLKVAEKQLDQQLMGGGMQPPMGGDTGSPQQAPAPNAPGNPAATVEGSTSQIAQS